PDDLPGLARVVRSLPAPVEFVGADVLEDHPLPPFAAIGQHRVSPKNHLSVFELSGKVEITALVVDPGLLPRVGTRVEQRDTPPAQMQVALAREVLFDHAAIQHSPDAVGAVLNFSRVVSRPRQDPFTDPEIELALFGRFTWISGGSIRLALCQRG